jgi:CHAT domain-containing protein
LVIIPAGAMCDMPFESLLEELPSDPERFKTHAYLIKQHSINYAYSATLLKEMSEHEVAVGTETYLGFAPSFGEGASSVIRGKKYSLAPLTYNSVEVKNIQKLLGEGQIYEGEAATEDQFKKLAGNYSIIHFATHGLANNQDPDYSLLAFTEIKDEQENEFLYVSDMYNMELNAELVVLSACETALGKNFRGEGIMSLARGFSYAGAKSIFTTLWSVNDQATFQIVERFYKNLQDGLKKDEALQQAKLDFIENGSDLTAHPFLWSPYIMIGDTDELDSISSTTNWVLVGGGFGALVLVLIGGIFVARRKS